MTRGLDFVRLCCRSYCIWTAFWLALLVVAFLILLSMNIAPFAIGRIFTGNLGNPFLSAEESQEDSL